MAAIDKDYLDDSSSSGDVVITEQLSEGDSDDVICVESSVDKSKEVVTKNCDEQGDSDSDCCIILEKESSVNKQDDGPSLDCDSFEEFKRESDELVTSTPKHGHGQEKFVAAKKMTEISHTTIVDDSSDDKDDTDSSDDNVVIIGDISEFEEVANDEQSKFVSEASIIDQTESATTFTRFPDDNSSLKAKACSVVEENNNVSSTEKNQNVIGMQQNIIVTADKNNQVKPTAEKVKILDGVKDPKVAQKSEEKNNNCTKRSTEENTGSLPVAKKPCFVFGTTVVLATNEEVPIRHNEVPLSEQLAISSEEDQESLDEEKGGEFWMQMITGNSSRPVVEEDKKSNPTEEASDCEKKEVKSQAWSAEEVNKTEVPSIRKSPKKCEIKTNLFVKVKSISVDEVDNEEDSSEDDKISLAPSLELFSGDEDENKDDEQNNNQEDSDDDIGLAIYSLGNYCKRMLRGVLCSKRKCSWVHYMDPGDAVTQFYRICSNRSVGAVVRFYRFFTNLEVQAQMVTEAQELLARTDPGDVIDIDPKQVCRDVFKAMVKVSNGLDLSIDQYMEMVEISSSLYSTVDGKATLVPLFRQTSALLADAGPHLAGARLVKWSWTSLYLNSLSNGVVLPAQFYTDLCNLLASHKMIPQLVEVLLYTAIVPSLTPPLAPLAEVLTSPPEVLTDPHATAIFTAQTLSRLCMSDWVSLSKLGDIKPGVALLAVTLKNDDPSDVCKFYDSLPEIPGLNIPDIAPPAPSNLDCWMRQQLAEGKWEEVAYHFCSLHQQDVEAISDFAEKILLEVSQLCGQYKLMDPIPALYAAMLPVVTSRECEVHTEFFRQLGVALMVCLVTTSQWDEAGALVRVLANQLQTDFLHVKPPAVSQFSGLDRGMVPLFVLEVLVWTKQRQELVKYLELWDCLASMETELGREKRNTILTSVLECLAAGNTDTAVVDIMIRVSDLMTLSMRRESNVVTRRREEVMSNTLFQLMLNMNLSGSRLWSRYQLVKSCNHQLDKVVTRGIVMMLSYRHMMPQATVVYKSAVKWGVYSTQATSRPFTLRLTSSMVVEEIFVIVIEFLSRVDAEHLKESLNVFVKMEETSTTNCAIKHLNCVRSSKMEAMARVEKVLKQLEPPLGLRQASVPYIPDELVRRFLVLKQQS
eukprot:GFUD01040293.1.p1 GENE.GFUD01040293.1~~GFUD01040293.1.p1  ORF type:complete len:1163 (+),score=378.45 GFUD01040293.1:55-3489(+)